MSWICMYTVQPCMHIYCLYVYLQWVYEQAFRNLFVCMHTNRKYIWTYCLPWAVARSILLHWIRFFGSGSWGSNTFSYFTGICGVFVSCVAKRKDTTQNATHNLCVSSLIFNTEYCVYGWLYIANAIIYHIHTCCLKLNIKLIILILNPKNPNPIPQSLYVLFM